MENPEILSILSDLKSLYAGLGILTVGAAFGGAWALVRFGIARNSEHITRIGGDVNTLYERTNAHNADISRLDERSLAIQAKLDLMHKDIINRGK